MPSLTEQLALLRTSSKVETTTVDRKKRQKFHQLSLVFDKKTASAQDFDTIYSYAAEALTELQGIDPRFSKFWGNLFSETSIEYDVAVQSPETLKSVENGLKMFVNMVSPYLHLNVALYALEWLVRRFQINLHQPGLLLFSVIPYYSDATLFLRFLSVIPLSSFPEEFHFLLPAKKTLTVPSKDLLINVFTKNHEFYEHYSQHVIEMVKQGYDFDRLHLFWSSSTILSIVALKQNEHTVSAEFVFGKYLPGITKLLGRETSYKAKTAAYMTIAVLFHEFTPSPEILQASVSTIIQNWSPESYQHGLACISRILSSRLDVVDEQLLMKIFDAKLWKNTQKSLKAFTGLEPDDAFLTTIDGHDSGDLLKVLWIFGLLNNSLKEKDSLKRIHKYLGLVKSTAGKQLVIHAISSILDAMGQESYDEFNSDLAGIISQYINDKETSSLVLDMLKRRNLTLQDLELKLGVFVSTEVTSDVKETPASFDRDVSSKEPLLEHVSISSYLDSAKPTSSVDSFLDVAHDTEYFALQKLLRILLGSGDSSDVTKFLENGKFFNEEFSVVSFLSRVATDTRSSSALKCVSLTQLNRILIQTGKSSPINFASLIPTLLTVFTDTSENVRKSCAMVMKSLLSCLEASFKLKKNSSVWAGSNIYGHASANHTALWLGLSDSIKLLKEVIVPNLEDLIVVPDRLHGVFAVVFESKDKKSSLYLTFCASQALAVEIPQIKLALLKLINQINAFNHTLKRNSFAKAQFFSSLIESYPASREKKWLPLCDAHNVDAFEFESEVVNLISSGERGIGVKFLEDCLRSDFKIPLKDDDVENNSRILISTSSVDELWEIASQKVKSIWSTLKPDTKYSLLKFLVDEQDYLKFDSLDLLYHLDIDLDLLYKLLQSVSVESSGNSQSSSQDAPGGTVKRRRRSSTSSRQLFKQGGEVAEMAEAHLRRVSLLLTLIERKGNTLNYFTDLKLSKSILGELFDILSESLSLSDANMPTGYVQENLVSSMLLIVRSVNKEDAKIDFSTLRMDTLISFLRSSGSPRVQNQILLLISELATLSPLTILHSLMPVFTFMGSHTVRQDDEFSFQTIKQTIMKVIPSLIETETDEAKKQEEVEFLLSSFVGAFFHIPRHRRVHLFSTLVRALGVNDATSKVLFLMGQRSYEARVKHKQMDVRMIAEFTETFLAGFSVEDQLQSVIGYIQIWKKLPHERDGSNDDSSKSVGDNLLLTGVLTMTDEELVNLKLELLHFIDNVLSGKSSNTAFEDSGEVRVKPKAKSLGFKIAQSLSLKNEADHSVVLSEFQKLLASLLELLGQSSIFVSNRDDYSSRIYSLLGTILNLLPISQFVESIKGFVESEDGYETSLALRQRAFLLLKQRFGTQYVSEEHAVTAATEAVSILLKFTNQASIDQTDVLQVAVDTLELLVTKFGQRLDETTLKNILQVILGDSCLRSKDLSIVISSFRCLTSIIQTLGIRSIAYFAQIVPMTLHIFRDFGSDKANGELVQLSAISTLSCLIRNLPTFMLTSMDDILELVYVSSCSKPVKLQFMIDIVEHMDLKGLIPVIARSWDTISVKLNNASAVQDSEIKQLTSVMEYNHFMMASCVEKADKKVILTHASLLMSYLIQTFEIRSCTKLNTNTKNNLESEFMKLGLSIVLKLNDKTFRPLFTGIIRWATEGGVKNIDRLISFFKFLTKLQEKLRSIITNYYTYIFDFVIDELKNFSERKGNSSDTLLKRFIFLSLELGFKYDQEQFWLSSARFQEISVGLVDQLSTIEPANGKQLLRTIASLVDLLTNNDDHQRVKVIDQMLLGHLRNGQESTEVLLTVKLLKILYRRYPEFWLSLLPQLIPILSELLERDEETLELELKNGLIPAIEKNLGESIEKYMVV